MFAENGAMFFLLISGVLRTNSGEFGELMKYDIHQDRRIEYLYIYIHIHSVSMWKYSVYFGKLAFSMFICNR